MRYVLPRPAYRRAFAVAVVVAIPIAHVTIVFAQDQGAGASGGTTSTTTTVYPGGVLPPPPGVPLGGGNNTSSSSRAITGDQTDHFDSDPAHGGGSVVYTNPNGSADFGHGGGDFGHGGGSLTLGGDGTFPDPYVVKKGDTLWAICDTYFKNPYQWPRIWSFNPQIQNPHWIYPGDQLRLRQPDGNGPSAAVSGGPPPPAGGGSLIDRRRQVAPTTVFLRDTGFIDDDDKDNWGEITGAAADKMFLTDTDEVYVRVGPGKDVKIGQELTIFRPVRKVAGGNLVQIQGSIRVNEWNEKDRVARGTIVETMDVIERGARVGPIGRKFDVVPPTRNDADVHAQVLASVYPHTFYGQEQVVFIDKGADDGVKIGNRFFVMRRGDAWRKSLASDVAGSRIALEDDSPAAVQQIPAGVAESKLPTEVVGELRVLSTRKHTSTCLLTASTREIELGDDVVSRKGY
ncbi:MAG TPA: LysM peptidoglycan-binding domain-containing protein [Polyangiaceae bacterium]